MSGEALIFASELVKRFRRRTSQEPRLVRRLRHLFGPRGHGRIPRSESAGQPRAPDSEWLVAVDGVSFEVRPGEVFGLLGPNGAGKSTTIRILSTLIEPTSGTASICGHDVRTEPAAARACLGVVMAGERHLYWKLTGRENLEYFATLYHVPARSIPGRVRNLLDRLGLSERADELVERYSTGMRQRLSIARALVHDPPALLLDEPTLGLDPQAARALRELILELRAEGRAILLTTHYMEEADFLCDRVAIIDHGRIVACDTPEALKRRLPGKRLFRLELAGTDGHLERLRRRLPDLQAVEVRHAPDGSTTSLTVAFPDGRRDTADVVQAVFAEGLQLLNFSVKEPTLEDVFIAMTGRALRD